MNTIISKLLVWFGKPVRAIFLHPALRYKLLFSDVIHLHPDELVFRHALEFAAQADVKGDYLEFGVWKGRSFARVYSIWRHLLKNKPILGEMRFYAFDSFEGLPEITAAEDKSTGEFKKGEYAATEEVFRTELRRNNVDLSRVTIVKGWFAETLTRELKKNLPLKRAAVVFIDVDLYEAAVPVLEFLTEYLVDGSLIMFDDWFCFRGSPERGEQKAFREWLKKHPDITASEYRRFNWKGNSFIIHRF